MSCFVPISRRSLSRRCSSARRAFTLLEIILALAVLAGAVAVLTESIRQGHRHAFAARELSRAELLAAGKLAEITAGIQLVDPVQNVPFETDPDWQFSIETDTVETQGLVEVRVTVERIVAEPTHPVQFSLVRWIPDPASLTTSSGSTGAPQ